MFLAFYGLVFWSGLGETRSRVFAAFWILSPVTWYLAWPSAEVWSASLVVLSIVLFTRGRYAWAVLLASLAATQNPPLLVFVAMIASVGSYRAHKDDGLRAVPPILLAAGVALLPNVFYFMTFGTFNLITATGGASPRLIAGSKILSLFFDLNQGILVYAPVLLLVWFITFVLSVVRRSWLGLALAATTLLMAALTAMSANWNSGGVGITRYAIWILPVLAWNVLEVLQPERRLDRWSAYALVVGQGLVALTVLLWPPYAADYVHKGWSRCMYSSTRPDSTRQSPRSSQSGAYMPRSRWRK